MNVNMLCNEIVLALSRNSFIQLAFLVGSDYTNGIDGIGPVSAIEILSFFESKTKNMNIEEKLLKIKEIANSKSDVYSDVPFVKKLKSARIGNGNTRLYLITDVNV